jgi:hypothetical protein
MGVVTLGAIGKEDHGFKCSSSIFPLLLMLLLMLLLTAMQLDSDGRDDVNAVARVGG